jgi:hypothetical protein
MGWWVGSFGTFSVCDDIEEEATLVLSDVEFPENMREFRLPNLYITLRIVKYISKMSIWSLSDLCLFKLTLSYPMVVPTSDNLS